MARRLPTPYLPARTVIPDGKADVVLDVLVRELRRSMDGLVVPGNPRPYYLQYTLRHVQELRLRAAYGSLLQARESTRARLFADVRVGNHSFDNVIDGGLEVHADERESADFVEAPDDLEPRALQIALWRLTQAKFDEALKDYYEHRKILVSEYLKHEIDAFSREAPVVHREPFEHAPFPRAAWEQILKALSEEFLEHPDVHDPAIELSAERVHRWCVTSEGTRVLTDELFISIDISGWILTDDGVYSESLRQVHARALDEVPDQDALRRLVAELLQELAELRKADTTGAFVGPALFAGQAASTLFHEALGHRLEGERLVARGESRTFAGKLGERILPSGLDVFDDPTMEHHRGLPVWGRYRIDDQGMRAQRCELVKDGRLTGFLQSRTPIPNGTRSNGHGRHDGVQPITARMANLVVEADPGLRKTWDELERDLLTLAKAQGRRHAMIIKRIQAGETTTSSYDFQVFKGEPAEVYLVDVESGRRTRVRNLEIIGTPLSALQRIVAFGGESELDQGYCSAESGSIPVSGIAPAILLSEIEMQQAGAVSYHEPLLPPPFADDGSRGRTSYIHQRGRRRPPRE